MTAPRPGVADRPDVRGPSAATTTGPGAPGTALDPAAVDLTVELAGAVLPNPVVTASGCFASGREIDRFHDVADLGAVVAKSVTLEPRAGLPTPRMAETPSGMLNAIGLQNPGVDAWLADDLPWLAERGARSIVSIAGTTVADYVEVARRVERARRGLAGRRGGVVAVEVNLSCPNVEHRGLVFACHPEPAAGVVAAVTAELGVPVLAKLTPDVTDLVGVARAVVDAGADGLSLINTTLGMAIDPDTGVPRIANTFGGLSGPAIRPIAIRAMYQVHQALPAVPAIGMGGLRTVADAVEMIRAGATAVAIGTASFVDPFATADLVTGLRRWLAVRGIRRVSDLRGQVHPRGGRSPEEGT